MCVGLVFCMKRILPQVWPKPNKGITESNLPNLWRNKVWQAQYVNQTHPKNMGKGKHRNYASLICRILKVQEQRRPVSSCLFKHHINLGLFVCITGKKMKYCFYVFMRFGWMENFMQDSIIRKGSIGLIQSYIVQTPISEGKRRKFTIHQVFLFRVPLVYKILKTHKQKKKRNMVGVHVKTEE